MSRLIAYLQDVAATGQQPGGKRNPSVRVGRKNCCSPDTPAGLRPVPFFTASLRRKANSLKPYAYMRYLFDQLPLAKTEDDYRNLLPPTWMPPPDPPPGKWG